MAITDPRAIKFSDEVVRPLAESFRALKARVDAALVTWAGGGSALIPNDATLLEDGRAAQGVSRLTGADITAFVALCTTYQTFLNGTGAAQTVSKPCVRQLEVV